MISVNERAYSIFEDLLEFEEDYGVKSYRLNNGATVIDCGVAVRGSYDAGMMFIQISMGGLSGVNIQLEDIRDVQTPFVYVYTDFPDLSCLGCQMAGWKIELNDFKGLASGPARALALKPKEIFDYLDYEDDAEYAVVTIESDRIPDERVVEYIAKECDVEASEVYIAVTSIRSLVGVIQISGRVIENALFRAKSMGFDVRKIRNAMGKCPVAPIMEDEMRTMAAANDSICYYGSVYLTVDGFDSVLENITFDRTKYYGKTFYEIVKDVGDIYKLDPDVFSPARVLINDVNGGFYSYGTLNPEILLKSYGL